MTFRHISRRINDKCYGWGRYGFPPMMPGGIAGVILGGGPMMHMEEIHVQNVYDEEVDSNEINDGENQFEEIEDESDNENDNYDENDFQMKKKNQ